MSTEVFSLAYTHCTLNLAKKMKYNRMLELYLRTFQPLLLQQQGIQKAQPYYGPENDSHCYEQLYGTVTQPITWTCIEPIVAMSTSIGSIYIIKIQPS